MNVAATRAAALSPASPAPSAPAAAKSLGQSDFLKLLTTQLTTQDPFNPVDNSQMIAQMAQFSQVTGIAQMNSSLSSIQALLSGRSATDTASWIGRSALVENPSIAQLADGSFRGELMLAAPGSNLTIDLVDASGTVVHSAAIGDRAAGPIDFAWSPEPGTAVPGPLQAIVRSGDQPVAATTRSWTSISAIIAPAAGSSSRLQTSLGPIDPASVLQLS